MLSAAVASLAAILVMSAVAPAIAASAKDDLGSCDERSFAPDDATLRVGRTNGTGRIRVLRHSLPRCAH
jgi:hypothetical protein